MSPNFLCSVFIRVLFSGFNLFYVILTLFSALVGAVFHDVSLSLYLPGTSYASSKVLHRVHMEMANKKIKKKKDGFKFYDFARSWSEL